jgi:hypothetical protein
VQPGQPDVSPPARVATSRDAPHVTLAHGPAPRETAPGVCGMATGYLVENLEHRRRPGAASHREEDLGSLKVPGQRGNHRRAARLGATAARATCLRVEAIMGGSRVVAGLLGLVLIALALSDAAKLHIWTNTRLLSRISRAPCSLLAGSQSCWFTIVGRTAGMCLSPSWVGSPLSVV